jgi:desulfoferrodoxin-like iron-binding protein
MSYQIGKRFKCESCGTQVLVSKPSETGDLECCGQAMAAVEPKQLASSD